MTTSSARRVAVLNAGEIVGPPALPADADQRRRCEHALALVHTQRADAMVEVDRLLAADPHCVFAHCLRVALAIRGDDAAARPAIATSVAVVEGAAAADDPARRHADAARAWLDNDPALALERYGAIVAERPHDVLALVTAHALDFRLGRRRMLRDRVAAALRHWSARWPGYGSVLAMYAFGLEENGQYVRARRIAHRALDVEPGHPVAIHALVHVLEMRGRASEGLAFLASTEASWNDTAFRVHLA